MSFLSRLLLVFGLVFALLVSVTFYFSYQIQHQLVDRFDTDLRNIVNTVHFSTERLSPHHPSDQDAINEFIDEIAKKKGVREVNVVSSDHQVIASTNPNKVGTSLKLSGNEMIVREELGVADSLSAHNSYHVNIPIMRNGKPIGMVQTSLIVNDYQSMLRIFFIRNAFLAIVAFLLFFIVSIVILYRLNRPLRELAHGARKISGGDLSVQLDEKRRDEIGLVNVAFNKMTQNLREQKALEDQLRGLEKKAILSETAAMLSHEIRNPLNLINLTADHLAHEFKPVDAKQQSSFLELTNSLKQQVQQLNRMVNDFLAIGKPMHISRSILSLESIIDEAEIFLKPQLLAQEISCTRVGTEIALFIDPEQFCMVIINLLANAVAVVSRKGTIQLFAEKSAETIRIKIIDSGPGILPEDCERIFEPYVSKRPGGTGLGLALVKRIIEAHGGTIIAGNREGGGGQFTITLPDIQTYGTNLNS